MAATGLLGINPYQKGLNLDITSKPANLAIQLAQKEQAKQEAMTKYLLDYDRNITGAGMAQNDIDGLMSIKNQAKKYFFDNKKEITNTALDNGKAYTTLMSMYDNAERHIAASKDKVATTKAIASLIAHANNNRDVVEPETYKAFEASQLPINSGYQPFNIATFKTYKPFNPYELQKELKTLNTIPGTPELITVDEKGKPLPQHLQYERTPMNADFNNIKSFAYNKINDSGYIKMLNNLSKEEINQIGEVYNKRTGGVLPLNDPKEVSLAFMLTNLPKDYTQTKLDESKQYTRDQEEAKARRNIDYAKQNQNPTTHLFDIFGSGTGLSTKNLDIKDGTATKKDGSLYSGTVTIPKEQLPSDFSAALSAAGISKNDIEGTDYLTVNYKDGKAESVSSELLGTIDANQMARYQDALNKRIYGASGAIRRATVVPRASSNPSGKVITTADFLKMPLADRQKFLNSGGTHHK